jgi:hypothetical protein
VGHDVAQYYCPSYRRSCRDFIKKKTPLFLLSSLLLRSLRRYISGCLAVAVPLARPSLSASAPSPSRAGAGSCISRTLLRATRSFSWRCWWLHPPPHPPNPRRPAGEPMEAEAGLPGVLPPPFTNRSGRRRWGRSKPHPCSQIQRQRWQIDFLAPFLLHSSSDLGGGGARQ